MMPSGRTGLARNSRPRNVHGVAPFRGLSRARAGHLSARLPLFPSGIPTGRQRAPESEDTKVACGRSARTGLHRPASASPPRARARRVGAWRPRSRTPRSRPPALTRQEEEAAKRRSGTARGPMRKRRAARRNASGRWPEVPSCLAAGLDPADRGRSGRLRRTGPRNGTPRPGARSSARKAGNARTEACIGWLPATRKRFRGDRRPAGMSACRPRRPLMRAAVQVHCREGTCRGPGVRPSRRRPTREPGSMPWALRPQRRSPLRAESEHRCRCQIGARRRRAPARGRTRTTPRVRPGSRPGEPSRAAACTQAGSRRRSRIPSNVPEGTDASWLAAHLRPGPEGLHQRCLHDPQPRRTGVNQPVTPWIQGFEPKSGSSPCPRGCSPLGRAAPLLGFCLFRG
jgi:hypothetical protein